MNFKPTSKQISYLISLLLSVILIILVLLHIFPGYYYLIPLLAALICLIYGINGIYKIKNQVKNDPFSLFNEKKKNKIQKLKRIKNDKEHVMSNCPNCNRNIRLPYKPGKHGVTCPICKTYYEVKI